MTGDEERVLRGGYTMLNSLLTAPKSRKRQRRWNDGVLHCHLSSFSDRLLSCQVSGKLFHIVVAQKTKLCCYFDSVAYK